MPVLSSSVSCVTLNESLSEAADSNLPSDIGAVGIVQVDDLDQLAAVDPGLRAVGLDEVRDVPGAAAAAGQPERQDRR